MLYKDFVAQHVLTKYSHNHPFAYCDRLYTSFDKRVFPIIGNMDLELIHPTHTGEVLRNLQTLNMSADSITQNYSFMKTSFKIAIEQDLIHRNPCIECFNRSTGKKYTFPENIEAHNHIVSSIETLPLRNLFGFCYATGITITELLSLHHDDYDLNSHMITLNSYMHQGRYLISDFASSYLDAEIKKQTSLSANDDNLLFVTNKGKRILYSDTNLSSRVLKIRLHKPKFSTFDLTLAYGNMLRFTGGDIWV